MLTLKVRKKMTGQWEEYWYPVVILITLEYLLQREKIQIYYFGT